MKILFIIERLYAGGRQRRLVELIKSLSKNKSYDLFLITMKRNIHYKEILVLPNLKIYFIERRFRKDPLPFLLVYKQIKKINPDIIHTWSNMVTLFSVPAKVILHIPLITNEITDAPDKIEKKLFSRLSFIFADKILANSKAGLEIYNAPQKKSDVIYNGFSFDRLQGIRKKNDVLKEFQISTKFIVGMIASFSKYKDYPTYINAAKIIINERKDITFLAVGQFDYHPYMNNLTEKELKYIKFIGKRQDVESIMNICDIGVLATFTEGLPNTILEFMALGKPVIVTDGGGTKELVVDGECGYLMPRESPEILANKIISLIDNEILRREMGNYNKNRVMNRFSIEKMVNRYKAIYNETVHG